MFKQKPLINKTIGNGKTVTLLLIVLWNISNMLYIDYSTTIANSFRLMSNIIFITYIVFKGYTNNCKMHLGIFYKILMIWTILILFYSFCIFSGPNSFIKSSLQSTIINVFCTNSILPYLLPFFILTIDNRITINFAYIIKIFFILLIIYLVMLPVAINNMINFDWSSSVQGDWGDSGTYGDFITNSTYGIINIMPPVILIYWKKYLKNYMWIGFCFAFLTSVFQLLFMARRGAVAINLLYIILYIYLTINSAKCKNKILFLVFTILLIYAVSTFIINNMDTYFALFFARLNENTRSAVENSFYQDMDTLSWIFGRGFFGTYFEKSTLTYGYRPEIETGYLNIILKGGIIYLMLYLGVLLRSFYFGYFKSKNMLVKSFSIIILVSIIKLYPSGTPLFDFNFFMIWLGVFVCNNYYYRNLNDTQVFHLLFKRKD